MAPASEAEQTFAVIAQIATNERLDDIRKLLEDEGYGEPSRAELIRALVFAVPCDSAHHIGRIVQVGRLRLYEDTGQTWSLGALGEAETILGWYSEDRDRAELVEEIERLRKLMRRLVSRIGMAQRDLEKVAEEAGL